MESNRVRFSQTQIHYSSAENALAQIVLSEKHSLKHP